MYPIFSLERPAEPLSLPPNARFHCHIAIPADDEMQFITKEKIGLVDEADIQRRLGRWGIQTKTEILIVRPVPRASE